MQELSIIQKTYDLIKWYIPILNRLPRDHKFLLGDRIINGLYSFLEKLIIARYARDKLTLLEPLNGQLDIFRYQTRLNLYDSRWSAIRIIARGYAGARRNNSYCAPRDKVPIEVNITIFG